MLWVLAVTIPLALLSAIPRINPHRPLVFLALVPALLSIGLFGTPAVLGIVLAIDAAVVVVAAIDLSTLPRHRWFGFERQAGRVASLRKTHPVSLTLTNYRNRAFLVWVRDGVPPELGPDREEFSFELAPRTRATLHYQLHVRRRGAYSIARAYIRVRSRLGLWMRYLSYNVETLIHVYPDMQQLSQYALLARVNRLNLVGVRRVRRIGQDNEFERLRDYNVGDNYKHIDWRSSARRRKLTVKDFQQNQSQRLIFLIDCGRMMTNEAAGLSLLDHALNSMLMLSYVALSRGDAVGLVCFSDEVHSYVPPASGLNQMNRLLHASFDRFPTLVESRYDRAFLYLATNCRKRSLVTLVTNVVDEVNSNQVEQYLGNLVGRHLPLGVLLRDRRVFEFADQNEPQGPAMYRAAAAAEILTWRQQVLVDLHARGVLTLDLFPDEMTAPMINQYLEIKARHLL
jgi:uncharacterized protein (DUF58 family)